MKKIFKIVTLAIIVICFTIFTLKVVAEDKPTIVDAVQYYSYSSVLYSNGELYVWGVDIGKLKIANVKKIIPNSYNIIFLDNEGILKRIDDYNGISTDSISNVKDMDDEYYISNDNKLYSYDYGYDDDLAINKFTSNLIFDDVLSWKKGDSVLILTSDNSLYGYGTNTFGKKINGGEDITETPVLLAENVVNYATNESCYSSTTPENCGRYYITSDNKLYIMSSSLAYPTKIKDHVTKFLYNSFYVSNGKTYYLKYNTFDGKLEIKDNYLLIDEELVDAMYDSSSNNKLLTKNGNFYNIDYKKMELIDTNVKQILRESDKNKYLKNDGKLFELDLIEIYDENYNISVRTKHLFSNIKKIIDENMYITNDETLMVKSYSSYDYDIADYNGTSENTYRNFVLVKGLPNVPVNIVPNEVKIDFLNTTEFTAGDTFDYYANVFPFNAINKSISWTSSDESVVTVNDKGTLNFLAPGTSTIKAKFDNYNIFDEVEVTVYPKNNGINFLGEKTINLQKGEEYILEYKLLPEGTLEQNAIWSTNAGRDENGNEIAYFDEYNIEEYSILNSNQRSVSFNKVGTYTVTVTTIDELYKDTVTFNVVQDVTQIYPKIAADNSFDSTIYIYMKEKKYIDLDVVVYPNDAKNKEVTYASSDESIATVDENGRVTAHKGGKAKITISAVSNDVSYTTNLMIFEDTISTRLGDVDGDGMVDILDLVKLRRHIAGVEELE